MARILVTGGAGYVGAPCARQLQQAGHDVHTLDNLSEGHVEAVTGRLHQVDLRDASGVATVLALGFDAVVHFAALSRVAESILRPGAYHDTNVIGTQHLLTAMRASGCPPLVFSSSAAVYGVPKRVPIPENTPRAPVNPYGATKLAVEHLLESEPVIRSIRLRYFNAAGATIDGELGEAHRPETHLIPLALKAASEARTFHIFGTRYPTRDGTCLRDYVHIEDLARAHVTAVERLLMGHKGTTLNLGTGKGVTVRELLTTVEQTCQTTLNIALSPARLGDPPALVADARRAQAELQWCPRYDLRAIIEHAWAWHCAPRYTAS